MPASPPPEVAAGRARSATRSNLGSICLLGLLLAGAAVPAAGEGEPGAEALVVAAGSVARSEVVAVGRDLVVAGEVRSHAAVIRGSAEVSGEILGDLVVMGGDAHLLADARIGGDVFALGGQIEAAPGSFVAGRIAAYPSISSVWLTLMEGPSIGLSAGSPVVLGAKLALITAWLALLLVLFASTPREVLSTSEAAADEPFRSFAIGLVGVLALFLTALLMSAFAGALVGIPLLLLVVLFALLLKLWGMIAVFHALGAWVMRRVFRRRSLPLNEATVGLLALGVVKLVPYVGTWAWTLATLVAVGAALTTKFGRREAWFEAFS